MENKFELKKDISTPNGYKRAGEQKTKAEWEALFPNCFDSIMGNQDEWFIDLNVPPDIDKTPVEWQFVSEQFEKMRLRSISYQQGAVFCIKEFIRVGNLQNALSLLQKEADRLDAIQPKWKDVREVAESALKPVSPENEYAEIIRRRDFCYIAIGLIKELASGSEG